MLKQRLFGLTLLMAGLTAIADAPPPKEMVCRACHGTGGAQPIMPTYPKLNGQNKAYLVQVLKSYRSGERKGGMSVLMVAQSSALSDSDIEALASYYASQP